MVALHVKLSELLAFGLALIEDYDCETVGMRLYHIARDSKNSESLTIDIPHR